MHHANLLSYSRHHDRAGGSPVWLEIHLMQVFTFFEACSTNSSIPPCRHVFHNLYLSFHGSQEQDAMTALKTTAAEGQATSDASRQRRAHKKSRRGCSSCKLRRVKCDERRPCCHRCKDFGVACTYDGKVSALSFAGESSFSLNDLSAPNDANANTRDRSLDVVKMHQLSRSQRLSESSTVLAQLIGLPSPPDSDGGNSNYGFGRSELEIFQRFNERTVLSVGSSQTAKIYQREIIQLACCVRSVCPKANEQH
jgi:hypothetical protein